MREYHNKSPYSQQGINTLQAAGSLPGLVRRGLKGAERGRVVGWYRVGAYRGVAGRTGRNQAGQTAGNAGLGGGPVSIQDICVYVWGIDRHLVRQRYGMWVGMV